MRVTRLLSCFSVSGAITSRCKLDCEVQVMLNTTKSHLELVLLIICSKYHTSILFVYTLYCSACLKNEKANLGCHGKGPGEAWDCKREMVDNCLDQNSDFEQYDSAAIADFVSKFRESEIIAENTKDYLKRKTEQEALMANDFVEEEPKVVTLGEKFDKNNKGKVKVGFVRRQQKESKNNIDTTDVALEHQAAALAYINQSNDEPAAPAADDEPAAAESEFSFANFEDEDNFEDAPIGEFNFN